MTMLVLSAQQIENRPLFDCLGICSGCTCGVLVRVFSSHGIHPASCNGDLMQRGFEILNQWPDVEVPSAPKHTPDIVARVYLQAVSALKRGEFDAAGGMARKALDVATREIEPSFKKSDSLAARIKRLHETGKLTDAMKDWAEVIREDGNNAAHDSDLFTEEEAVQICEFAATFLEYQFTMPGRLRARQEAKKAELLS